MNITNSNVSLSGDHSKVNQKLIDKSEKNRIGQQNNFRIKITIINIVVLIVFLAIIVLKLLPDLSLF
jgi:hypothetical protein